jgi:hypothetical protein
VDRYELGLTAANSHAVRIAGHHIAKLLMAGLVGAEGAFGTQVYVEAGVSNRGQVVRANTSRRGNTAPADCAFVSPARDGGHAHAGPSPAPGSYAGPPDGQQSGTPVEFTAFVTRGSGLTVNRVYDICGVGTRPSGFRGALEENDSAVRASAHKDGPGMRDGGRAQSTMRQHGTGIFSALPFGAWGAPSIRAARAVRELGDAIGGSARGTVSPLLSTPSLADRIIQCAGYGMWAAWATAVSKLQGFKGHDTPDRTPQVRRLASLLLAGDDEEDNLDGHVTRRRELVRAFLADNTDVDPEGAAGGFCDVNVWVAAENRSRRSQRPPGTKTRKASEASPLFRLYLAIWWGAVGGLKDESAGLSARTAAAKSAAGWLNGHVAALDNDRGGDRNRTDELRRLEDRVRAAARLWADSLPADASVPARASGHQSTAVSPFGQAPAAPGGAAAQAGIADADKVAASVELAVSRLADATWGLAVPLKVLQEVGLKLHAGQTRTALAHEFPLVQELIERVKEEHGVYKACNGPAPHAMAFLSLSLSQHHPIPTLRSLPAAGAPRAAGAAAPTHSATAAGGTPARSHAGAGGQTGVARASSVVPTEPAAEARPAGGRAGGRPLARPQPRQVHARVSQDPIAAPSVAPTAASWAQRTDLLAAAIIHPTNNSPTHPAARSSSTAAQPQRASAPRTVPAPAAVARRTVGTAGAPPQQQTARQTRTSVEHHTGASAGAAAAAPQDSSPAAPDSSTVGSQQSVGSDDTCLTYGYGEEETPQGPASAAHLRYVPPAASAARRPTSIPQPPPRISAAPSQPVNTGSDTSADPRASAAHSQPASARRAQDVTAAHPTTVSNDATAVRATGNNNQSGRASKNKGKGKAAVAQVNTGSDTSADPRASAAHSQPASVRRAQDVTAAHPTTVSNEATSVRVTENKNQRGRGNKDKGVAKAAAASHRAAAQ